MSKLRRVSTEVFYMLGTERRSMLVTTLTKDVDTIKREALHKAEVCYGLKGISNLSLGGQTEL